MIVHTYSLATNQTHNWYATQSASWSLH